MGTGPSDPSDQLKTWERIDSFVTTHGITQMLVEYEGARTSPRDTLNMSWSYDQQPPGTISQEADGFRVYHSHENDTIVSISRAQQFHANDLFEQNFVGYEQKLKPTDKLLRGTQPRLPMRV